MNKTNIKKIKNKIDKYVKYARDIKKVNNILLKYIFENKDIDDLIFRKTVYDLDKYVFELFYKNKVNHKKFVNDREYLKKKFSKCRVYSFWSPHYMICVAV